MTVAAQPQRYTIAPSDASRLELRVAKTGLYRGKVHVFLFPKYQGTLLYDAARPEASQASFTLAAAAINCIDTWVSAKDLRKVQEEAVNAMLAADRYPEIKFASSEVRALGDGRFEMRGTLTIRDKAKPSIVNVALEPGAGGTLRFKGDAKIRLTDYGLKPPSAALGLIGTENEMSFSFTISIEPDRGTGSSGR
jgi:polyisoprenoid-binding protein YceI